MMKKRFIAGKIGLTDLVTTAEGKEKFKVSVGGYCRDGGMAYNERVITVGIGWILLASATSRFSGYIKLAYYSSAKGLQ